jgi:hypothetical protein
MGSGEVAQTMYTHVSKCKNNKIKGKKKNYINKSPNKNIKLINK